MRLIVLISTILFAACISANATCTYRDAKGKCLSEDGIGRCLLEVGGKKYLDGMCNIGTSSDGTFTIGTGTGDGRNASKFFAYVERNDDGTAEGKWNGIHADRHADDRLGTLRQEGSACWVNSTAKVCGWR